MNRDRCGCLATYNERRCASSVPTRLLLLATTRPFCRRVCSQSYKISITSSTEQSLQVRLQRFVEDSATLDALAAEKRFLPILQDLLEAQGFDTVPTVRPDDAQMDYLGHAKSDG